MGRPQSANVAPLGKLVPGDDDEKWERVLNDWLVKARGDAGITAWPNNALRHSFGSYACAMTEDYPKDAGKTWFDVLPTHPPTAQKSVTREPGWKWSEPTPASKLKIILGMTLILMKSLAEYGCDF